MIALLAFHSIRLKNFAELDLGRTFVNVTGKWWIVLSASETKENRPDERAVDEYLTPWLSRYLSIHRSILARGNDAESALWLSSNDGKPMSYKAVEKVITETTRTTLGINVSPHLFRTSGASSCAAWAGDQPHLATALLHHRDPTIANDHYNRNKSVSAAQGFAMVVRKIRDEPAERRA